MTIAQLVERLANLPGDAEVHVCLASAGALASPGATPEWMASQSKPLTCVQTLTDQSKSILTRTNVYLTCEGA